MIIKIMIAYTFVIMMINLVKNNNEKHSNAITLIIPVLYLLVTIASLGYYAIILIYPIVCKLINENMLTLKDKIIFILLCIPYPINLISKNEFIDNNEIYLQLHSIIIPLLLLYLFINFLNKEIR